MKPEEIRAAEERGRLSKENARKRKWYRKKYNIPPALFRNRKYTMTPRDDLKLWRKLHSLFTKKEYVSYHDLPEALKTQIQPFEEFLFPVE